MSRARLVFIFLGFHSLSRIIYFSSSNVISNKTLNLVYVHVSIHIRAITRTHSLTHIGPNNLRKQYFRRIYLIDLFRLVVNLTVLSSLGPCRICVMEKSLHKRWVIRAIGEKQIKYDK